jgi:hypothetical protein
MKTNPMEKRSQRLSEQAIKQSLKHGEGRDTEKIRDIFTNREDTGRRTGETNENCLHTVKTGRECDSEMRRLQFPLSVLGRRRRFRARLRRALERPIPSPRQSAKVRDLLGNDATNGRQRNRQGKAWKQNFTHGAHAKK